MANVLTKKPKNGSMPLTGHLKELRNRLVLVGVVFFVAACLTLTKADAFVDALISMAKVTDAGNLYTFVAISPQEKLIQYFRVSIVAAVIVTVPLLLYEVWAFAKPGLKKSEYRFFGFALLFGLVMFCVGVAFAYYVTLPFMLNFLATVGNTTTITSTISVEAYITFVLTIFIIFGCVFEMPLLSVILSKIGIASPALMRKGRGIAIVIIFIIAAIITPPDIVSQTLVAIPMVALYELSIGLALIFYKPRSLDEDSDDEDSDDEDEDDDD